jgi:hypothetical protein
MLEKDILTIPVENGRAGEKRRAGEPATRLSQQSRQEAMRI